MNVSPAASMRPFRFACALALVAASAGPARAQLAEGGGRALGLGRAGVALGQQSWGHVNPAAWSGLAERRGALSASQAFGLSELRLVQLAAAAPTPVGTVALSARSYGFAERRETRVVAGLARGIVLSRSRRLDVGVSGGVETAQTAGYGSVTAVLVSVGVQGDVVPGLRAGLAGRNLAGILWSADEDVRHSLATVPAITAGIAYSPSAIATVVLDAEQDLDAGLSVRGGIEVRPVPMLALRVGAADNPSRFSAGAGVRTGGLRADIAVERHASLGLTPAVGIELAF